jgi:glycosyltransferase involved in cell wall biosynthesis
MKISVIIPVYNSEKYLKDSIESILNQTFQDFEILIIDDGSIDSSKEIINNYVNKDKRVKYFYQENQGPGPARNKGLQNAKGTYISFLDSDDYLEKDTLETAYLKAEEMNLDILFFNAKVIYESANLQKNYGYYTNYYKRKNKYEKLLTGKELLKQYDKNWDFLPHVGFQIIKRSLIVENENWFINAPHEDNLFTIKNLLLANKVYHIDKEFYVRRLRENSIMTSKMTINNVHGYFISIIKLIEFTQEKPFEYDTLSTIANVLRRLQYSASKILKKLDNNEVKKYKKNLSNKEFFLFDLFFSCISQKINDDQQPKEDIIELKKQVTEQQKIIQKKNNIILQKNNVNNDLQKQLKRNKRRLDIIQNSNTYKIGKIITYIPRKIKNVFQRNNKGK